MQTEGKDRAHRALRSLAFARPPSPQLAPARDLATRFEFTMVSARSLSVSDHHSLFTWALPDAAFSDSHFSEEWVWCVCFQSGKKKVRVEKEENVTLGPTVRDGEHVFGVAHIFASFNDTFVVSSLD